MTIITDVGETMTVRQITRTYNNYGDETQTVTASVISGLIVPMTADSEEVKSGILDTRDALGIFGGDDTAKIKNGNEIYASTGSYTLEGVQEQRVGGAILHVEANLKNITKL